MTQVSIREAKNKLTELVRRVGSRDPFDRLLLAQRAVEDMELVTIDAALAGHPLSATSGS
jgi:PIN domain nuclease of toxin-antitoxin system